MLTQLEEKEARIYDELYRDGYPSGGPGFPLRWASEISKIDFRLNSALRVLDVGCGHAILSGRYKDYTGIDISKYVISMGQKKRIRGKLFCCGIVGSHKLFENEEFDCVFCFDVLEHIPEEAIPESLLSLSKIKTKYLILSICTRDSAGWGKSKIKTHKTVRDQVWWINEIKKRFASVRTSEQNRQKTFCVLCEQPCAQ